MRHRYRGLIVAAGVVATVAAGGGLTAWAGWSAGGSSTGTTARSGRVPMMEPPRAEILGKSPKIDWDAGQLPAGVPVDPYVVIRIQGPTREEVCRTNGKSCRDAGAPAGSALTYVVHATKGTHWVGEDSKPSNAVVVPGPKTLAAQTNEVSAVTRPVPGTQPAPDSKIPSTPAGTANRGADPADDVPAPDPKPAGESTPTVAPEPSTSSSAAPDGTGSASGVNATTPPPGTD
jgi:hypothetical protein